MPEPIRLPLSGGCHCGAVRYRITRRPIQAGLCHCRDCQRFSGSAFALTLKVPAAGFAVTAGEPTAYEKRGESGGLSRQHFCGTCGSWLFARIEADPDAVNVRAGTLDDPSWVRPVAQSFTGSAIPALLQCVPVSVDRPAKGRPSPAPALFAAAFPDWEGEA